MHSEIHFFQHLNKASPDFCFQVAIWTPEENKISKFTPESFPKLRSLWPIFKKKPNFFLSKVCLVGTLNLCFKEPEKKQKTRNQSDHQRLRKCSKLSKIGQIHMLLFCSSFWAFSHPWVIGSSFFDNLWQLSWQPFYNNNNNKQINQSCSCIFLAYTIKKCHKSDSAAACREFFLDHQIFLGLNINLSVVLQPSPKVWFMHSWAE